MATEIRFEPTLFLLLGTSSGQIGWRLKELLRRAYGDLPILRFLWVDADTTLDPEIAPWFSSAERAELVGFNGDAVLANLNNFPTIKAWWNRESRLKAGFVHRGAGQMRPVGRLALFRMYNDRNSGAAFVDKLRLAAESILQIDNIDATERMSHDGMRFVVERGGVRVVIIFSTCGGTGSSMSFDLAYLCRHFLREANPSLMSIALLPSIMDKAIKNETPIQRERIRANTYAWFKESNYLLENPIWRVTYPEGAALNVQAPPFDMNFVLEMGNQAGNRLHAQDDIFNMLAAAVFLDTGSSIGGAIRGFNANVSVLMEEFQGRRRAYSSLAAAALVYPAGKILTYCGARLGQMIIRQVCLAPPDKKAVAEAASALLGRLRLRDDQVLEDLQSGEQIGDLNLPAIRKSNEVEDIRRLLAQQEESNTREREYIKERMVSRTGEILELAQKTLAKEISKLVMERGARFAQAVLEDISADLPPHHSPNGIASLPNYKAKIAQNGVSESDTVLAEQEYQRARERLRATSGDVIRAAQKAIFYKSWQESLNRSRNDCLTWLGECNQRNLQLHAQRQALALYDQSGEQVRRLKAGLAGMLQALERAATKLEDRALESLEPSSQESGIYELALEAVDADYIRAYFTRQMLGINAAASFQSFARETDVQSFEKLADWDDLEWAKRLELHAQGYFSTEIENTSLLEALTDYYGPDAALKIEEKFDRLVRYCHPFWQYDTNSGIQGQEGKSIIGVEDENSTLIPARYMNDPQYEVKSTGFKHRIDFARVQHGLPAFLLRDMADYKAYYDQKRKGLDPLHIFPEAYAAEEVIPEAKREFRNVFAAAAAFGYIIQVGSYYYFDPQKEYATSNLRPVRENRLEQGREKAEEAFVQRDDLVQWAEQLVERDIVNMGNQAAIRLLDEKTSEYKQSLAKMTPDGDLRRQFEQEIRALMAKQQQLGKL